jgi:hypothetical protein
MKIQPKTIEVDIEKMQAATLELTQFFEQLCWRYGDYSMGDWRLVFTPAALSKFGGLCVYADRCVYITTVDLARDVATGANLDGWRGLVIHEFCHAWNYQQLFNQNFKHTFGFHISVSLLLAKHGLSWDQRLYNLCESQKDDYQFRPRALFRMCRFLARRVSDFATLKEAQDRLLFHFNTSPKTAAHVSKFWSEKRNEYRDLYFEEKGKAEQQNATLAFFEKAFYCSLLGVLSLLIVLTFK